MGTPAQAPDDIKKNALSEEDMDGLSQDQIDFLRLLAVFFASAGEVATRFGIFSVKDANGLPHSMGKLHTLVDDKKKFHFVGRRKKTTYPEEFEEFVVKVERIAGDVREALPADDPTCGWEWDKVRQKWVWVCRT